LCYAGSRFLGQSSIPCGGKLPIKVPAILPSAGGVFSCFGKNASGGIPLRAPRASRKATQSTPSVSSNAWGNFRLGNLTAEHVANKSNATSAKRQKRPAEDIQLSFDHA